MTTGDAANPGFANPLGEPRFAAVAVGSARRQESKKLLLFTRTCIEVCCDPLPEPESEANAEDLNLYLNLNLNRKCPTA